MELVENEYIKEKKAAAKEFEVCFLAVIIYDNKSLGLLRI